MHFKDGNEWKSQKRLLNRDKRIRIHNSDEKVILLENTTRWKIIFYYLRISPLTNPFATNTSDSCRAPLWKSYRLFTYLLGVFVLHFWSFENHQRIQQDTDIRATKTLFILILGLRGPKNDYTWRDLFPQPATNLETFFLISSFKFRGCFRFSTFSPAFTDWKYWKALECNQVHPIVL